MTMWIEKLTGSLEQKRQYKQYRARIDALPEPYRSAAKALQRYFMYNAGMVDPDTVLKMEADFVELWERAAADSTPIRTIVGEDPVEFAEAFVSAYSGEHWIDKERERLKNAIDSAVSDEVNETGSD